MNVSRCCLGLAVKVLLGEWPFCLSMCIVFAELQMNDLPDLQQHVFHMLVIDLRMPAKGHVVIGHCFSALNSGSAAKHKHRVCR